MSKLKIVTRRRLADTETPVSAYLKLCSGKPDSFLLESVETHGVSGRYSIVAYDPIYGIELDHDQGRTWNGESGKNFKPHEFFNSIRDLLENCQCETLPGLPAIGSFMGFVGYDAVRLIERLPTQRRSDLPVARLVFPSRFVVFDHLRRSKMLIAIDSDEVTCSKKLDEIDAAMRSQLCLEPHTSLIDVTSPSKDRFCEAVTTAKEYIRAGDIFQVVLSDNFTGSTDLNPFEVYRCLRVINPSPYMFYLNLGSYQLLGASPETLVKVRDGRVTVMPIAGTRGRSDDPVRDRELEAELMESEKERAEHLMLVDLARNDVGRVSEYGTVGVEPFMTVQRYSHVMHIVSQVQGTLRPGTDAIDAFIGAFPAGTVSGAPKVRAMEIIDELETESRGPYAGAVGYFGPNGIMDTCIAIRTVLFQGDQFTIRVGAGIVADSIPEMEYKEISNKAAQSIAALEAAAKELS
jgi:anthranilate synthase component 1